MTGLWVAGTQVLHRRLILPLRLLQAQTVHGQIQKNAATTQADANPMMLTQSTQ